MTSRGSKFADVSQCRWFRTSVRKIYSSPLPISRCARSRWICSSTVQVCQTFVKACNNDELIANTNAANVPCHISTFLSAVELPTGRFFDLVYVFVIVFVGVLVKVRVTFVKRSTVFVQQGVKCFLEESESTLTFSLSCLCSK